MENKIRYPLSNKLPVEEKGIFNTQDFKEIYYRIDAISPNAERQWGKMNVVQMLNHLKVAMGSSLDVYLLKDESVFIFSQVVKFLVLRILKRFPKDSKTVEGFKMEMNNTLDFNTEKQAVLTMLQKAHLSASKTYVHPFFGTMSKTEWGKLVYLHFDHHLRQFGS